MMRNTLLALGLLLSTATQLRGSALSVGPGEICLIVWIASSVLMLMAKRDHTLTPALRRVVLFWTIFAVAESIGALTAAMIRDDHDPLLFMHDALAYPLLAALSCLAIAGADAGLRMRRVAKLFVFWGVVFLVPQLAAALNLIDLPGIKIWFGDRFQGWSENPNQLAFLCAVMALVALHLADSAVLARSRITAVACAIVPIWVGRLTKADTFTLALTGATAFYLLIKLRTWSALRGQVSPLRSSFAAIATFVIPVFLLAAIPLGVQTFAQSEQAAAGLLKNNGKEAASEAALRLELWREAISRGADVGMLGLGPGPHLPIPESIMAARQSEPGLAHEDSPVANGTANFEAHNTVLDLFVQGGLIASACFLWLTATALVAAYKARLAGLLALLIGLSIFSITNLVIRMPIFWFGIVLSLAAADAATRASAFRREC